MQGWGVEAQLAHRGRERLMPIFQVTSKELKALSETNFGIEGIMERKDIQRLLSEQISVLDESLMVIAEEFGDWLDSSRRIDFASIPMQI
jgi:hypothetical protein